MATALEFLGISPGGRNDIPALDSSKEEASAEAGRLVVDLVRRDVRPSQIITKASIENAAASVAATGGSTNGVLHLVAIAKELAIDFTIDDFDAISARTPIVADLKPFGRYVATDVHKAGGIALVARELKKDGLIDPTTLNVDGRTLGEIADAVVETEGQEVVVPLETPIKSRGGLAILRGNLAPGGCVLKLAGEDRSHHRGPARVFDSEEETFAAVKAGKIVAGRRRRDPLRGPRRRSRDAGDAPRHGRDRR